MKEDILSAVKQRMLQLSKGQRRIDAYIMENRDKVGRNPCGKLK